LKPEDVVITRLFLLVFTYMLLWLTSSITQIMVKMMDINKDKC